MADLRGTSNFCARYSIVGMLFMVGYITLYDYVTFVHTYVLVVVERSRSIVQCKWSIQICWFKKINLNRLFSLFVFSNIKMTYICFCFFATTEKTQQTHRFWSQ
jgi:hypothetical protein